MGVVEARGQAKGILVFWDNQVLKLIKIEVRVFLTMEMKNLFG